MVACGRSILTASVFSVKNEAKSPAERKDETGGGVGVGSAWIRASRSTAGL